MEAELNEQITVPQRTERELGVELGHAIRSIASVIGRSGDVIVEGIIVAVDVVLEKRRGLSIDSTSLFFGPAFSRRVSPTYLSHSLLNPNFFYQTTEVPD